MSRVRVREGGKIIASLHVSLQKVQNRAIWGYLVARRAFFYQNPETLEPMQTKGSEVNLSLL